MKIKIYIMLILMSLLINTNLHSQDLENYKLLEDQWGNSIDLSEVKKDIIISHFSTSNCGYCLFDGNFIEENYFKYNKKFGGQNYYECLYNPQLDIYSYIKHYRDESTQVISFTPYPDKFVRAGFPGLVAFRNGKIFDQIIATPYEKKYHNLKKKLWSDKNVKLHPSSPLQMATRFILGNNNNLTVHIIPDNSKEQYDKMCKRFKSGIVKYEKDLNNEDMKMNLYYNGSFSDFNFTKFENKSIPIVIQNNQLKIGEYIFDFADIGLNCCFPNPHNYERYIVLSLKGENINNKVYQNWVDFTLYNNTTNNESNVIMNGFFLKDENNIWSFSDSLIYISPDIQKFCKEGFCKIPSNFSNSKIKKIDIKVKGTINTEEKSIILGNSNCRFPSLAPDKNNHLWVTWEEDGNILAVSINTQTNHKLIIEGNESDSFNPLVVTSNNLIWFFYLNNADGFYRLYGKYYDGIRLSDEILLSDAKTFDVITPAAISDNKNNITLAWSEWKANQRILKYRTIENKMLGNINTAKIKMPKINYLNAWFPSLALDQNNQVWGAWNQHYPAILGVCSGNFIDEANSVTKLSENGRKEENGGYPSIVIDKHNQKRIIWETWGWDIAHGKSQNIFSSYYDEEIKKWSIPEKLNANKDISYNQTPQAVVDNDGIIWVIYSSRSMDDKNWSIHLTHYENNIWSKPIQVSNENENARAPKICVDAENSLWFAWHSGIGENMKVKVIKYVTN